MVTGHRVRVGKDARYSGKKSCDLAHWPTPASPTRARGSPCWTSEKSPRMVPAAAARPSVAPTRVRTTLIASSPSSTAATSGPDVMNSRSGAIPGFSTWSA